MPLYYLPGQCRQEEEALPLLPVFGFSSKTCKAAVDPIFLTFSLRSVSSILASSPSPHLLCGSDYALHLSVLSCFRFLCLWLQLASRVSSCAFLRSVWISASETSSLMTGFIWMRVRAASCERSRANPKRSTCWIIKRKTHSIASNWVHRTL